MNEKTIRKLRHQFILVSMAALFVSMLFIAGLLYFGNFLINRHVINDTLDYIIENDGDLVQWRKDDHPKDNTEDNQYVRILEDIFATAGRYKSTEFQYSTRYFAVEFDDEYNVTEIKTNHIVAVTPTEAEQYGLIAIDSHRNFGKCDNFYYKVKEREDGTSIVVYIDSTDIIQTDSRIFKLAMLFVAFGLLVAAFFVRMFSYKVIQTEVKNAELQKQFMTNASHELKTPLAVIRANTEMEEMLSGETEWTQSTMRQIDRLNGLIQNLVMITKAEETNFHEDAVDVDITKVTQDTVKNYLGLAAASQKELTSEIAENVTMRSEEAQIRQLLSLLIDNAIKYCDEDGRIHVSLAQRGKGITLKVSNDYKEGENVNYSKFFERFYREDESHNLDRGGYGIGLSIAESLVHQYEGDIGASWKDGVITFTCILKPAKKI